MKVPARAWVRPALMLVGGIALTVVLVLIDQVVAAVGLGLFSLFMAYWTSPLRAGQHTPLAIALAQRTEHTAIVLWAPGDPLSSRLQATIRSANEDVTWVNVLRDPEAQALLAEHGGAGSLPLVMVGEAVQTRSTVAELRDLQDASRRGE